MCQIGKNTYNEVEMNTKLIWLLMFIGSTAGSFIPELWGDSALSIASVLCGGVGAILGVWLGYRLSQY